MVSLLPQNEDVQNSDAHDGDVQNRVSRKHSENVLVMKI